MKLSGTTLWGKTNMIDNIKDIKNSLSPSSAIKYYLRVVAVKFYETVSNTEKDEPVLFARAGEHISNRIGAFGIYAPLEILALKSLLLNSQTDFKGKCMLDIGANIGNHSVSLAPFFGKVHCFEVNPDILPILSHNTRNITNCQIHQFGASDKDSPIHFQTNKKNLGKGSIVTAKNSHTSVGHVRRIDSVLEIKTMPVGFIKIDVEGHETQVITGMAELLKEQKPIIAFELHADQIQDGIADTTELLKSLGYKNFAALSLWPRKGRFFFGLVRRLIRGFEVRYQNLDVTDIKKKSMPIVIAY